MARTYKNKENKYSSSIWQKKTPIDENFKIVYMQWKQGEITAVKAMDLVSMKSITFYRRVKEYESN